MAPGSTRRTPVPMLLDSFPSPPSHIPSTPTTITAFNPPPSLPPSAPLPPVPGPSKITEADTLQLLLLSKSNRSRRSSKYSLSSSLSSRNSVISVASLSHQSGSPSSPPRSATRTPTSRPSLSMASPKLRAQSSMSFTISEHGELDSMTRPPPMVLRDVVSPMLPIFDSESDSYDDDDADAPPSPRRRRRGHHANESISSIDMRDILGAASGGEDDGPVIPLSKPIPSEKSPPPSMPLQSPSLATSHSHKSSLAYLNLVPDDLTMSTISDSYSDLASASTTTLRSSSMADVRPQSSSNLNLAATTFDTSYSTSSVSTSSSSSSSLCSMDISSSISSFDPRAPSPDIATIIQSTPKPSKISGRSFSMSHGGNKTPRRSGIGGSLRSSRSMKNVRADVDEFGALPSNPSARLSKSTFGRPSHYSAPSTNALWDDAVLDDVEDPIQALDGSGSDSDSSIDLHTPLPHLMVRDGLLSNNSKLLSSPDSRATTPQCGNDRPQSTMSMASKSGVIKDERDTPMRRVRHRDGRLLRGGIGLTTGLGWSDSEDEDAPSPLTRRLSTLNLSRRSSATSFFSTRPKSQPLPHPLSRSYSSGTLYEDAGFGFGFDGPPMEDDEDLFKAPDWDPRTRKPSAPPTAWSRKMSGASVSTRNSTASSGRQSFASSNDDRSSVLSNGSTFSLEITSPEDAPPRSALRVRSTRASLSSTESQTNRRSGGSIANTPSTASTISIPLPVTPQHEFQTPAHISNAQSGKKPYLNKDKSLPPLPGVLKKTQSRVSVKSGIASPSSGSRISFPSARTYTVTSSNSTPAPPAASSIGQSTPAPVRPLQLPRQVRAAMRGDRPAVPVPSLSASSIGKPTASPVSASTAASAPNARNSGISSSSNHLSIRPPSSRHESPLSSPGIPSPIGKGRPRTGTGMVYKSSGGTSASRVRAPTSYQASTSLGSSGIGRPGGIPRSSAAL